MTSTQRFGSSGSAAHTRPAVRPPLAGPPLRAATSWRAIWVAGATLACALMVSPRAQATPFYGIHSASRCNTCHVEPLGWANPPQHRDRRCTLDCQGCHVSPSGGGMRTPMGRFYGEEILPMWGTRPSESADPYRFLPEGYPDEGRYSLWDGFEGWWAGEVPFRTIEDRYGSINPEPVVYAGADVRAMAVAPTDGNPSRDFVAFPMQAEFYIAAEPIDHLVAYLDLGYQGSTSTGIGGSGAQREWNDVLWLRELFLMVNDLKYGTYVRAGRFNLPYGWRLPDHTAYVRRGMFDQYRQAYGAEVGMGANYGWLNLAVWRQGIDGWPGDNLVPGAGVTTEGGVRYLGFQAGGSFHAMRGLQGASDELMAGPMWALNLGPFSYLGELDWRRTGADLDQRDAVLVHHELRYGGITGLAPSVRWEWEDPDVLIRDDTRRRLLLSMEWNPIKYLQVQLAWRREFRADSADPSEVLVQLHTWIF